MITDIDIMKQILAKYDEVERMTKVNKILYDHLIESLYYYIQYSTKYDIPLPKKEELYQMVKRARYWQDQISDINKPSNLDLTGEKNNHRPNSILTQ